MRCALVTSSPFCIYYINVLNNVNSLKRSKMVFELHLETWLQTNTAFEGVDVGLKLELTETMSGLFYL
jgi:hypothetical protein